MTTTTGTGPGAVTNGHTGWDCPNGASLIAHITGPGRGRLPAEHGCIYVCPDHQAQAEARITAAGHIPDTDPAPPRHRWDPWPCGRITTYGDDGPELADALTTPATEPIPTLITPAHRELIEQTLAGLIPGARGDAITITLTERIPGGHAHAWTGTPAGLAEHLHTALSAQTAEALRTTAAHINYLPEDPETDPGRGECADLLRTLADQIDTAGT